ncbi:MAG: glycosyltransferase family 4 protein [Chthoniobacterales bacterium]
MNERRRFFIASGCPIVTTTRYRCLHLQEQLRLLGHDAVVAEWFTQEQINPAEALSCDVVVLYRLPMSAPLEQLIGHARAGGKRIIFDTDDLVFEPELIQWHRGAGKLNAAEQAEYARGVERYLATLAACDVGLMATPLLAQLARRRGKPAFVHRNCIGEEMRALADELYSGRGGVGDPALQKRVVIGYGSGTDTHDVDFQSASGALLKILADFPQTELWIGGPLTLASGFNAFGDRVRRFPLADWRGWLQLASQFDIALAPLEADNVFCRAKSEIKFLEAAALGVPIVASDIDAFRDTITNGHDGFVARNEPEWIAALSTLIGDANRRAAIGEHARETVLRRHSSEARAAELALILPELLGAAAGEAVSLPDRDTQAREAGRFPYREAAGFRQLVINWLIPEPFAGAGGDVGIFRITRYLAEFGHECHVHVVPYNFMNEFTTDQIREHVHQHFGPTTAQYHRWTGTVRDADCTFATFWRTVEELLPLPNGGRRYYLVQDYEPYFYPIGTHQLLAEETYRAGLHCITLGRWLTRLLRDKFNAQADYFDFAVDTNTYWPRQDLRLPQRRICFYARPPTPRRIYEIGLEALRLVHHEMPEVELVFFGAGELTPPPDFPHVNRGLISAKDLATLFSSCDVGLVCSLTNPSFVPLEMLACRCAVVEIESERFEGILSHNRDAWLVQPTARALANGVLRLLRDDALRARLVEHGYERTLTMNWRDSARQVEAVLLEHAAVEAHR